MIFSIFNLKKKKKKEKHYSFKQQLSGRTVGVSLDVKTKLFLSARSSVLEREKYH